MCVFAIFVDFGFIFHTLFKEIEFDNCSALIFVGDSSDKPSIASLLATRDSDIVARLCLEVATVAPIDCYILDKFEGVGESAVVVGQVACHLQRRRHSDIECQLTHQCRAGLLVVLLTIVVVEFGLEESGRVVHRTTLQASERQDTSVVGSISTHRLKLSTASRLLRYPVGVGATKTCRTHSFVTVNHNAIFSRFLGNKDVVVVHPLRRVILASWYDWTDIARLERVVAIIDHKLIGIIDLSLVVGSVAGCLVMHNKTHTFRLGIVSQRIDIKVGISLSEDKLAIFPVGSPVFPTEVPTFNQHRRNAALGSEIDVVFDVVGVCRVSTVWL